MEKLILLCLFVLVGSSWGAIKRIPESTLEAAPYPAWVHSHVVWMVSGEANQTSETQLLDDYLAHNIPVGGIDIDSQWATCDNNFQWNTAKYPSPQKMIDYFHSKGVKVILWATSMINVECPEYQEGYNNNYFLSDGITLDWWHGKGSLIDYTNPNATAWWHSMMDNVLNMGVDGFKCDGTDPYVFELVVPFGYGGLITEREYANLYYRDFYYYSQTKNPEATIWARPCDSDGTYYCLEFAPKDVMVSGWVGDQNGNYKGIQDALYNMLSSAWKGYANYGSDIGGYLSGENTPKQRTKDLFVRWAQLGAFTPLMENGGNGEHRPWKFDNQTTDIYRNFVNIHLELGPYFLNAGTTALQSGKSVLKPLAEYSLLTPSTWDFRLWTDIFVAPITVENTTERSITFPVGEDWIDWWQPSQVYESGSTINYQVPLDQFPVFHRQGSILPLDVVSGSTNHGTMFSSDSLTLLISRLKETETAQVREYKGLSQEFSYSWKEGRFEFLATAHSRPLIMVLRGVEACDMETIVVKDELKDTILTQQLSHEDLYYARNGFLVEQTVSGSVVGDKSIHVRLGETKDGAHISISCVRNAQ